MTLIQSMRAITKEMDSTLQQLQDHTERLMQAHTLRLKVLKHVLFEGISHKITSRKRHNEQIIFAAGTSSLKSEKELSNIVQVMVDIDVEGYKKHWQGT